jgi:hypothetical protein
MADDGTEESPKFATIAHTFLFKVMDCIYQIRCPAQVPDFVADDSVGFSAWIEQSQYHQCPEVRKD